MSTHHPQRLLELGRRAVEAAPLEPVVPVVERVGQLAPVELVDRADRAVPQDPVERAFQVDVARDQLEGRHFHSRRALGVDVSSVTSG